MVMASSNNRDLLNMIKSPDKSLRNEAFSRIYKEEFDKIRFFVLNNSGSPAEAEDIFQDGMIILYEQVLHGNFKEQSSISTYLFAICKNCWFNKLKKSSTKKEILGLEMDFKEDENLVIDVMIADETTKTLASLIEKLGPDCQKLLKYYYYEKRKMKEIAQLMGLSNDQVVKNKKSRCLKKLKELAEKFPKLRSLYK